MSGVFSAQTVIPRLVERASRTQTVRLVGGAGMHNLAKVVTKDSTCEKDRSEANGAFDVTLGREPGSTLTGQ